MFEAFALLDVAVEQLVVELGVDADGALQERGADPQPAGGRDRVRRQGQRNTRVRAAGYGEGRPVVGRDRARMIGAGRAPIIACGGLVSPISD